MTLYKYLMRSKHTTSVNISFHINISPEILISRKYGTEIRKIDYIFDK